MLQSLLLRLPPLQERVANAVTFPTCQRADHNSDPVGNVLSWVEILGSGGKW